MVLQTGVGEKIWAGRQGMRQPESRTSHPVSVNRGIKTFTFNLLNNHLGGTRAPLCWLSPLPTHVPGLPGRLNAGSMRPHSDTALASGVILMLCSFGKWSNFNAVLLVLPVTHMLTVAARTVRD